ncbi:MULTISPECIES: GNAT family N-acetyltransferase [Streptococcus]|uniref:GNAT family N-acetyltransferase n=1 Tax=Streptococcus taonis TaxID=3041623 RepID=A0ABT6PBL0_9STRE|nr:GNAT family N-acetyltransferase [Streptococcus sp. ST22-14]MDI1473330.1 GNAT family N-acetyltransferase [Streptococcus sp. ST22-14]
MHIRLDNTESQKAQEIGDLIRSYNRSKREAAESEPLNLYVEDDSGQVMAGLVAETFGNWLEIEYLFVKEDLRGQGIGSQLLQQAESEAKKKNCRFAFVNTYQFQAPSFYQKHGYKEVFTLKDYPYTGQRHYYQKEL